MLVFRTVCAHTNTYGLRLHRDNGNVSQKGSLCLPASKLSSIWTEVTSSANREVKCTEISSKSVVQVVTMQGSRPKKRNRLWASKYRRAHFHLRSSLANGHAMLTAEWGSDCTKQIELELKQNPLFWCRFASCFESSILQCAANSGCL